MNVVLIDSEDLHLTLQGEGAGRIPTANSVVADVLAPDRKAWSRAVKPRTVDASIHGRFLVRFTVHDQLGIVAKIGEVCARNSVNIRSILQRPEDGDLTNFVLTTECTMLETVDGAVSTLYHEPWFHSSFTAIML